VGGGAGNKVDYNEVEAKGEREGDYKVEKTQKLKERDETK
jgi:hypothetical protein